MIKKCAAYACKADATLYHADGKDTWFGCRSHSCPECEPLSKAKPLVKVIKKKVASKKTATKKKKVTK